MLGRRLVRIALIAALGISLCVGIVVLIRLGPNSETSWTLLASILAVIAACVSAWSSQRVLELSEDEKEPQLLLNIDVTSRYQLVQLRLSNVGGSAARDVNIVWDQPPLQTVKGAPARFTDRDNGPEISMLPQGHSVSIPLGVAHRFTELYKDRDFAGELRFKTVSGSTRKERFFLTTANLGRRLLHDDEQLKTLFELQKIPDALEEIARQLQAATATLEKQQEEESDEEEGVSS